MKTATMSKPAILEPTTAQERDEAIAWLKNDAESLLTSADKYRRRGDKFMADICERNAAHSAALAESVANKPVRQ